MEKDWQIVEIKKKTKTKYIIFYIENIELLRYLIFVSMGYTCRLGNKEGLQFCTIILGTYFSTL